ncbi:unnamed protein product [Mytilus coruscus]|uniref:Uncharacterized protein n=1 Tax=Mytilus coruscus TaxID=42192 RepID=A0A6J8AJ80_MYTCO|nr:unnamed protein product [Mytilus coruscus]
MLQHYQTQKLQDKGLVEKAIQLFYDGKGYEAPMGASKPNEKTGESNRFYKNASSRRFVSEREDIVLMRMTYPCKIHKFRQQGRHIVYLDETWLNTNRVVKGDWLDVPSTSMSVFEPHCKGTHRKVPSGKGTRLIILDVGSSQQGLIPGCGLIFESKTNSSDYHDEMNKEHFTEWFRGTSP